MTEPQYHTLSNGLRTLYMRAPVAQAGYAGIAVMAGSRDELCARDHGLAHFVEHTIFKGTKRRSAWHILNRMEAVGGELNAFTTKSDTVIYTAFPKGQLQRSLDLLADLAFDSRFPAPEVLREREVVCDEIRSYRDTPSEQIFDDFEDEIFANTPLGHNILGSEGRVRVLTGDDCLQWLERYYGAGNIVLFYCGSVGHDRFLTLAEKYFVPGRLVAPNLREPIINVYDAFDVCRKADTHQAHVVTGTRLGALDDAGRMSMALLVNVLGGPGMNSLLNVRLREKRGLVYTVETGASFMTDTTLVTTYLGCDGADVEQCRRLVKETITGMATDQLNPRRLAAAKKQYAGQMLLGRENTSDLVISCARATLHRGRALSRTEISDLLERVTARDLMQAAEMLTRESTLILAPKN